jgi:hypothetical protein
MFDETRQTSYRRARQKFPSPNWTASSRALALLCLMSGVIAA